MLERLKQRRRRTEKRKSGQALVEMALVLPVLVILLFAIIDFGLAMFSYASIHAAAREGNRLAAINDPSTTKANIEDLIIRSAPGVRLLADDITVNVNTTDEARTRTGGQPEVTIRVNKLHQFIGPAALMGRSSLNLTATFRSAIATWTGNDIVNYESEAL